VRYKKEEIQLYKRTLPSGLSVYYYRVYTPDGKRLRISTGKSKKFEAKNYVNKLIEEGELIPDKKKNTLFSDFIENFWIWDKCHYVERKREREGITKEYVQNQRLNLNKHITPYFGKMKLNTISGDDIYTWLSTFKKKELSNKTANNNLNILKVILGEAHKKGLMSSNPSKGVTPLRKNAVERGILTPPEVKKLFSPDTVEKVWDNDIFCFTGNLLSALTGLRQGEVLAIRGMDIFPEYIHIEHSFNRTEGLKSTKTGDIRDIPISPFVYDLLLQMIKKNPEEYLFSFKGDKPIEGRKLTNGLYKALSNIEISKKEIEERNIKFHSWRHFFNTTLRRNGLADSKIQKITGHKTHEMTEHYTHWEIRDLREVMTIQESILKK